MGKLFPDEQIVVGKYFEVHQDWEVPIPGFFILASKRDSFSHGFYRNGICGIHQDADSNQKRNEIT